MPGINFHVNLTNGLVKESLLVDPGVKEGGEGGSGGEVPGCREFSRLHTAETVCAGGGGFLVIIEKVKNPGGGFGNAAVVGLFSE